MGGWDAVETEDESPDRLAAVQRMAGEYLKRQVYEGDGAWVEACKALEGLSGLGEVRAKR